MICTQTNRTVVTHISPAVLPPKAPQLSPAIRSRMQNLSLRVDELQAGGIDYDSAYAQAFCELAAPKKPNEDWRAQKRADVCRAKRPEMTIAEALAVVGDREITAYEIYKSRVTGRGRDAIVYALDLAVSHGLLVSRQVGNVVRYKAVQL